MEGKLCAIVFSVLGVLAVIQAINFYVTVNYQADIARGYVDNVLSTNSIPDMRSYLTSALKQLNDYNYHGAPVLVPTPYQNYDLIKADIQKNINNLDEYQAKYGDTRSDKSYAYQQTVSNTKASAESIDARLSEVGSGRGVNWNENPLAYILLGVALFAMVPIHLVTEYWETHGTRITNGHLVNRW